MSELASFGLVQLGASGGDHALFGPLGLIDPYRYVLARKVGPGNRRLLFVMLNPSTATHEVPDRTVSRCVGFARRLDCGWLDVGNAYAYRSTDPKQLWRVEDPVGPANDWALQMLAARADIIICGWGTNARPDRVAAVKPILKAARPLYALRLTQGGHPEHPLYVPGSRSPVIFS